jgi:farnesyl-diphosphate farnesyltransferase
MPQPADNPALLTGLLKDVSRSFYLTLRLLPGSVRPQIGLAYLLARATDTIADSELVPVEIRLENLEKLRARISGSRKEPFEAGELVKRQGSGSEAALLRRVEEGIAALNQFSEEDKKEIRRVLDIIISGQRLDLERFGGQAMPPAALESAEELEDYTYRVAGCVGEFWTRICRTHLFPAAALDLDQLSAESIRFGKGLQLVNVLRDLPADLRQGRCYLPGRELAAQGLTPEMLLNPANESPVRPIYDHWLTRAESHLHAGWDYTNRLPRGQARIRVACALPILIGLRTLELLRQGPILDPARRIKVGRAEVKKIMVRCLLLYPFQGTWQRLARFAAPAGKVLHSP